MLEWIQLNKEWAFSGIGVAIFTIIVSFFPRKNDDTTIQSNNEKGQSNTANISNIKATGDVNVTIRNDEVIQPDIKNDLPIVTDVIVTVQHGDTATIDFRVLNETSRPVTFNAVEFTTLSYKKVSPEMVNFSYLAPSQRYKYDISELRKGDKATVIISHYLPAGEADRFIIKLSAIKIEHYVEYTWVFSVQLNTSVGVVKCSDTVLRLCR